MRAGELRHSVTIQAPIGVISDTVTTDVDEHVPMKIEVLPPAFQQREQLAGGGLSTQTLYTVTCRYRTDLLASYTLIEQCCTQRTFQILSIVPRDKRDAVDMTCVTNG